ncbi:hypothetical protein H0H87_002239 [Tephrocybe sp. NHM501043]|nr:hypothetical protein H0H87_002239 [Tephrocybe sp. NHM501043]
MSKPDLLIGKCFVQVLPDELLLAIFKASCTAEDPNFPIVISSVTSRWRQIVINTTSFWTTIDASIYPGITTGTSKYLLFFERSKSQPIAVTIQLAQSPYSSSAHKDLSEVISNNASRIYSLVVRAKSLREFRKFALSSFNALPFPNLTYLEIDSYSVPCSMSHTPLFTGATSLQSLVFTKCLACAPLGSQLTHLEIRRLRCNADEFRIIFQTSPHLRTLILYKFGNLHHAESETLPIEAPSLRTLSLTVDDDHVFDPDRCECPLSSLVAPNLKRLEVHELEKSMCFPLRLDHHFRLFPMLESLRIVNFILRPENSAFIQKLSTLTRLELLDTDHISLWGSPTPNETSDCIPWKNLNTIALSNPDMPGRAQMAQAIRKSCNDVPRPFTIEVDWDYRDHALQMHADLPDVVLTFYTQEPDRLTRYDGENEDDAWTDDTDEDSDDDIYYMDHYYYELETEYSYDESDGEWLF